MGLSVFALFSLAAGAGAALFVYLKYSRDLPDISALEGYEPSQVTRIYDDAGALIAEYYIEKRILLPLEKIPLMLRVATIAVEDVSFYEHHGLNLEGIVRAMIANIRAGRVVQGGSSITQQVAKQLFLTPERTLARKIREAVLSIRIDREYTKNQILEIYLNHIYYGHGAYGVEAAAQTYFGKGAGELTLAEMAMIAGLPKAPSHYSPYNDPERARRRRAHALNRMVAVGAITKAQAEEAAAEPFRLAGRKRPTNKAPWFAEHVRRLLEDKYGATRLYRGGLIVRTTLDLALQRRAVEAVREGLEKNDKRLGFRGPVGHMDIESGLQPDWPGLNPRKTEDEDIYKPGARLYGWVLSVDKDEVEIGFEDAAGVIPLKEMRWAHNADPGRNALWIPKVKDARGVLKPGDIVMTRVLEGEPGPYGALPLALDQEPAVQGALLAMDPRTGYVKAMVGGYDHETSKYNRAVQARRQAGSSFKPIIYTAALENGFTPASVIIDSPIIYDKALEGFKGWKPMNFEEKFFGPTTIREAVTHSRNVVTIKTLEKVGIRRAIEYARKFGIESRLEPNLSLALGAAPVSLLEMVRAYATLANGGERPEPIFIKSVETSDGVVLEKNEPKAERVISREAAYLMVNIMKNVVREGTARRVRLGRPVAGKTGTTNNYQDAWFIGFTPNIACGVWTGRDDNDTMGKLETGARAAIPIWVDFMEYAVRGMPAFDFTVPENIVFERVDKQTGLLTRSTGEDAIFEAFVDGSQPVRYASEARASGNAAANGGRDL